MQHSGLRLMRGERFWVWVFLAPVLIGLLLVSLGPVVSVITLSFADWEILTPPHFVGIENYQRLLADRTFAIALSNTAYYVLMMVPVTSVLALLLALLMNQKLRVIAWYRTVYFMPVVTSTVAVALVWSWIYAKDFGLLNYMLRFFGVEPIAWLNSSYWAMLAISIMSVWGNVGQGMIIFLAGLQAIPQSYYEAAEVDGANSWQRFFKITLPLITPSLFFYFIITMIDAFQMFEQIYVMTRGRPTDVTITIVYSIYRNAFHNFKMGYASTQAIVLFAVIMGLTLIYWRTQEKWVVYDN